MTLLALNWFTAVCWLGCLLVFWRMLLSVHRLRDRLEAQLSRLERLMTEESDRARTR